MNDTPIGLVDEHGVLTDDVIGQGRPWAFVPTRPVLGPSDRVWPQLRRTTDGRLALLTYTSLAALLAGCGRDQPWVLVPVDWFDRCQAECRFDLVAVNVAVPVEDRRQQEEDDWPGKPEAWDED